MVILNLSKLVKLVRITSVLKQDGYMVVLKLFKQL